MENDKTPPYWKFAERFREARLKSGINPNELAKQLGIMRSTVVTWEKGIVPRLDLAACAADVLNVSLEYLIGKSDNPNNSPLDCTSKDIEEILSHFNGEDAVFLWKMFEVKLSEVKKRHERNEQ